MKRTTKFFFGIWLLKQLHNTAVPVITCAIGWINPLALELDIYSLAHHLCTM